MRTGGSAVPAKKSRVSRIAWFRRLRDTKPSTRAHTPAGYPRTLSSKISPEASRNRQRSSDLVSSISCASSASSTAKAITASRMAAIASAEARAAWYSDNAGRELTRLERLADLLANVKGYEPMSAIFYRTIIDRFGHLESDDSFGRRVQRAKAKYDELAKAHGDSIPALPK